MMDYYDNDAWAILRIFSFLSFGWQAYLLFGVTNGTDRKLSSHIILPNDLFTTREIPLVLLSNLGVLATIYCLYLLASSLGFYYVLALYIGPYIVNNMWLVGYTLLHHTSIKVPHYDAESWNWLKGALCTIDRPYSSLINNLHHNIGSTHVIHHLFSDIPHYNAEEATVYLIKYLESKGCLNLYNYDDTPIWKALLIIGRKCNVVDKVGDKYVFIK